MGKENYKNFREALLKTNSNVVALLGFKKNGKDILDKDWEYIYLIDGVEENTAKFELK